MQTTQFEGVPVAPTGACTHGPAPLMAAHWQDGRAAGQQGAGPDTVGLFFLLH